jgi:uncharacterized protein (DUF169 family)
MDLGPTGERLQSLLGTRTPPVAIAFRDEPPAGLPRVDRAAVAGCTYWTDAAAQKAFYTEAPDHYGCPVGAHTHAVPLPSEVQAGLSGLVGTMVQLQYLKMEDVPKIPTRKTPLKVAVYAPLGAMPGEPDVVLLRGTARQMMLLAEAAASLGISGSVPAMGRPTCAVIPQAINSGQAAASFGCIGNRVYTGAPDDEAYFAVPGPRLQELLAALETIVNANAELEKFHRGRLG